MSTGPPRLDAHADEDQWVWATFRYHSRTFSFAARLLPPAVQLPVATLYLFCRRVDTIADERVLEVGPEAALEEVYDVRDRLNATLDGRPPEDELLWRRLAKVHDEYALRRAPLYELIDGAIWDLEGRTVDTLDDLIHYSNLVGGSVGAMMLPFLLEDDGDYEVLEPAARDLGIAMQITNIMRDVGEDARELDRVYLPATLMREYGIDRDALAADRAPGDLPPRYPELAERVMTESERRYDRSVDGIDRLPWTVRLGIRSAARMYREIMNEVRRNDYDNLTRRAYVTFRRKCMLTLYNNYTRRRATLQDADARAHLRNTGPAPQQGMNLPA